MVPNFSQASFKIDPKGTKKIYYSNRQKFYRLLGNQKNDFYQNRGFLANEVSCTNLTSFCFTSFHKVVSILSYSKTLYIRK